MSVIGKGNSLPRQHWNKNILGFSLKTGQEFKA